MTNITRKRIWPVSLVATLGVIAMLAILAAVMWPTGGAAQAQAQAEGLPPAFPPGKPTGLTATVDSATQISLSWTHVGLAADRYDVERKSGSGAFANVGMPTDTSFTDSGLTASTAYTYQVRAVNMAGNGAWSDEATGMTMAAGTGITTPATPATPPGTGTDGSLLKSSSTTGSAGVKLTLIVPLTENLNSGSWVELYLEDDYQEPGDISTADVIFSATDGIDGKPSTAGTPSSTTGDGGTFDASAVEIDDGGEIGTADDDVVVISAKIPDMDPRDDYYGYPGVGQTLTMVVRTSAGIKNPSEAGSHSVGYSIIGGTDDRAGNAEMKLIDLLTLAKISLSADDGGRGKEVTISGSGFNNDTDAEAFVQPNAIAIWWDGLDCMEMNDAVSPEEDEPAIGTDTEGTTYCKMYANLSAEAMPVVMRAGLASADVCQQIVDDGDSLGTADVGSDDKFSIAFTVHQDEFDPGKVNYICAKDSESEGGNRYASAVKIFEIKDSLTITPETVTSGEEVTLKPRDFKSSATLKYVYLGGDEAENRLMCCDTTSDPPDPVQKDGSDYVFDMPGGYSGSLRITVEYSDKAKATATITVEPASLTLNQTEVAPNQSIIISGSGFSERATILMCWWRKSRLTASRWSVDESGVEEVTASEAKKANMPADDGERRGEDDQFGPVHCHRQHLARWRWQSGPGCRRVHHQGYRQ